MVEGVDAEDSVYVVKGGGTERLREHGDEVDVEGCGAGGESDGFRDDGGDGGQG